jgi:hypothetical protein
MLSVLCALALAPSKAPLHMQGRFVEACTCTGTCAYEATGADTRCSVMGAYVITKGTFDGHDISGVNMAYVISQPGNLLYLYAECPQSKSDLVKRLAFTLFSTYGNSQGLHNAHIGIRGKAGNYKMTIDNGNTASVQISPVMGGDGKTPVKLENVFGDPYDTLWQAKTIDGSFNLSGHGFLLKNSNAYYIADMNIDKKV